MLEIIVQINYHQAIESEDLKMSQTEETTVRTVKAYYQLLADLGSAVAASNQIVADQVTPANVFTLTGQDGLIAVATNSFSKAGELIPQAYVRYWKALQE